MVAFYCGIVDLKIRSTQQDHVVLESPVFQLVILRIPNRIADSIKIEEPPVRRESMPIKLVFFVQSIAEARLAARSLGGGVNTVSQEWQFEGSKICDGYDPEGNIFQLREPVR